MDGWPKRRNKAALSNFSGVVWTDTGLLDTRVVSS